MPISELIFLFSISFLPTVLRMQLFGKSLQRTMKLEESKEALYKSNLNNFNAERAAIEIFYLLHATYFATFHLDTFEASGLARLHSTDAREQ